MTYLDFKADAGYLVADENGTVLDFGLDVDFPEIRGDPSLLTFDGNNILYAGRNPSASSPERIDFSVGDFGTYEGKIEYYSILDYIEAVYGYSENDVTLLESGKLPNLPTSRGSAGYHQWTESVYVYSDGGSEGNCGIVSVSNALAYYSEYGGLEDLPARNDMTVVYPESDSAFYAMVQANGYHSKNTPTVTVHTIPEIVREKAIEVGYVTGGMDDDQTEYAFTETAWEYGYDAFLTTYSTPTWAFIKEEIADGVALQLCVLDDNVYDDHGMFITGYRLYAHLISYGMASFVLRIPCVSVYDGGSSYERWYDMTSLSNIGYSRASVQKVNELWVG